MSTLNLKTRVKLHKTFIFIQQYKKYSKVQSVFILHLAALVGQDLMPEMCIQGKQLCEAP